MGRHFTMSESRIKQHLVFTLTESQQKEQTNSSKIKKILTISGLGEPNQINFEAFYLCWDGIQSIYGEALSLIQKIFIKYGVLC